MTTTLCLIYLLLLALESCDIHTTILLVHVHVYTCMYMYNVYAVQLFMDMVSIYTHIVHVHNSMYDQVSLQLWCVCVCVCVCVHVCMCACVCVFRMLFEKPVLLTADHWYTAVACVSSPSGASSDAGSSGQREIMGPERCSTYSTCMYMYIYLHVCTMCVSYIYMCSSIHDCTCTCRSIYTHTS